MSTPHRGRSEALLRFTLLAPSKTFGDKRRRKSSPLYSFLAPRLPRGPPGRQSADASEQAREGEADAPPPCDGYGARVRGYGRGQRQPHQPHGVHGPHPDQTSESSINAGKLYPPRSESLHRAREITPLALLYGTPRQPDL